MDGLLLVNKPVGISSFDVIRRLRRITVKAKIGHAGTLDPLAGGLMIMLMGKACKQADRFLKLDKTYEAKIVLGSNSSTGDTEGRLTLVSDHRPVSAEIEAALKQFQGEIQQTPPIYSAIKIDGKEAYKLARAGKKPEMPKRTVTVHSLKLIDYEYPVLKVEADVSSGTYIRTLAEDIGADLGTGAHLGALVRTRIGNYKLAQAANLDDLALETLPQQIIELDKI